METASHHSQPAAPRAGFSVLVIALVLLGLAGTLWAMGTFSARPSFAMVTGSTGPYWDLIVKGAQDAANRHNVRLEIIPPPAGQDESAQTAAITSLIDKGFDGVAVSPNDPNRQARALLALAVKTHVVTFDADLLVTGRLCFIGTDNYDAGRMCGQMVRQAMPYGGKVIIAVGSIDKENGHRRRQGVIDDLLDRSAEPNRPSDPAEGELKGSKYTIVATLIDHLDANRATELTAEALKKHPDAGCIVGLFASTTPAVLKALEQANKLGQVKVVGFDANDETLAGVEKGYVYGTIVQDAYNIGYQSIQTLANAASGEANAIPLFPTVHLRCDEIRQDNLTEMKAAMAQRNKPGPRPPATQPTTAPATKG